MTGVGVGSGQKRILQPAERSTVAAVRANSGEKKRVSLPTMMVGFGLVVFTWPAMAAAARRTPEKVKVSAMTPRHPEVPNWIRVLVTAGYCISIRERRSRKCVRHRKSKG